MANKSISLIDHIESYLGEVGQGWSLDPDGSKQPFQVVECKGRGLQGVNAFCTLGLSDQALASRMSKKEIRHELFMIAPETFGEGNIPGILQQLGAEALRKNSAYLRGDVITRE